MKAFVASILILSIVSFQLSETLIYLSFKINQDYIAQNLCIEKDIEGSTCRGCCQLKNKLEQQEQKKESLPVGQLGKLDINFCTNPANFALFYWPAGSTLKIGYIPFYSRLLSEQFFHPPRSSRAV